MKQKSPHQAVVIFLEPNLKNLVIQSETRGHYMVWIRNQTFLCFVWQLGQG